MRSLLNFNDRAAAQGGSVSTISSKSVVKLNQHIGLFGCVCIIIGMIVGSGIFVSPVGITRYVGSVGMSLTMWGAVGVFSMLCALCYAELGACMPESGGEYIYVKHAWGDLIAFLSMWVNLILINPIAVAASSQIFAVYTLKPLYPYCEPPQKVVIIVACLAVALIVSINMYSVTMVTKLQYLITACKVLSLVGVIVIGLVNIGQGQTENFQNSFQDTDYSLGSMCLAFYSGFWAFGGWNYLNYVTGEVIQPTRNLPLGIMISIIIVTVTYILANIAYFSALTPREILQSSTVVVSFLDQTVAPLSYVVPALISLSVFGGMNGAVLSVSRLFYVAAKHHHLPGIIAMISVKSMTPVPSLLTMFVLITSMQFIGDIFSLIEMVGFSMSALLVLVFAGQVKLRWTAPALLRPIKVPLVVPAFLCLVCLVILCITIYQKPTECFLAVIVITGGVPAYLIGCRWKKPKSIQNKLDCITKYLQILLLVSAQDEDYLIDNDPLTETSSIN
ncbi:large neutral amino acids transporter small subunit 1 [Biomphalaria glabrata]|nr:large neutral amino acids transporter small subunit 1 [Biomphalaria glabrata]